MSISFFSCLAIQFSKTILSAGPSLKAVNVLGFLQGEAFAKHLWQSFVRDQSSQSNAFEDILCIFHIPSALLKCRSCFISSSTRRWPISSNPFSKQCLQQTKVTTAKRTCSSGDCFRKGSTSNGMASSKRLLESLDSLDQLLMYDKRFHKSSSLSYNEASQPSLLISCLAKSTVSFFFAWTCVRKNKI